MNSPKPTDNVQRLQDTFLDHLRQKRTPVTIFLANGVKLQGLIAGFDAFCIMLERDGQQQIVYKHSITTTLPAYAVDLQDSHADAVNPLARPAPRAEVIVERRTRAPLRPASPRGTFKRD